jgi:hypothetical protein
MTITLKAEAREFIKLAILLAGAQSATLDAQPKAMRLIISCKA